MYKYTPPFFIFGFIVTFFLTDVIGALLGGFLLGFIGFIIDVNRRTI